MDLAHLISTHSGLAALAVFQFSCLVALSWAIGKIRTVRRLRASLPRPPVPTLLEVLLVATDDELKKMEIQIAILSEKVANMATSNTASHKALDQRLTAIEVNMSRVVWLLIAAIVGGFMTFALGGGLVIG